MAIEMTRSSKIAVILNAGNSGGRSLTKSVSLGNVAEDADADKALAIIETLLPCLAHPLARIQRTTVTTIEA